MKKAKEKKPAKAKATAKKPTIEVKTETIPARHEFNEVERSQLGTDLANLAQEKTRTEEEKKVHMGQWSNKIKEIQGKITSKSHLITSGFEMRDTECEVRLDWTAGTKTYVRKSDGKQVEVRTIAEHERQQKLFDEQQEKRASEIKPGQPLVVVADAIKAAENDTAAEDEESPT